MASGSSTAAVTFTTAMPSTNYAVTVTLEGAANLPSNFVLWTITSKGTGGLTINAKRYNDTSEPASGAQTIDWIAIANANP